MYVYSLSAFLLRLSFALCNMFSILVITVARTGVMTLSSSEDPTIVAWVILTQLPACDRRADGRTDIRIY